MKLEHFAINVPEPIAMVKWYETHLGMKTVSAQLESPFMHFIADDSGRIMIELYHNPKAAVPDYPNMNPLIVHIAFVSENPEKDKAQLMEAGATLESDIKLKDGSHIVMMRDPWGICIQLCKRGVPMLLGRED